MIRVSKDTPPAFIISTHDDAGAVSTGAAKLYIALKENKVDAELHIYRSGGSRIWYRPEEREHDPQMARCRDRLAAAARLDTEAFAGARR